ncbi:sigma-70 family RNA polymerase sigma factor [Clostridium sp. AM33-3]|uniref:sigma-70 family RNA polymerase sigma factor n=1 Tax=Clostridium sp. AM33-3 TaxID=2292304 RepID=UPI000E54D1AD|nr:sigma-70 family RNA polymerase sigma factor [Clostridium sp. AM33-3]RHT20990.1 sigma-70 family RNA polymerase sigma factor [Clostridium sp. AM33-3]
MDRAAENERKKEFLRSYRKRKKHIAALIDQLEELKSAKLGASSCGIGDGMPHAHNQTDLSDYVAKLEELKEVIIHERYKLVKDATEVAKAIRKLNDSDEVYVLTKRYMMGWDWEKIAKEMGYAIRNVHYIHSRALEKLEIPEAWRKQD